MGDGRVFLRSDEEAIPAFTVDLMLDGSASRLHCQEDHRRAGYILAKSLSNCGIPVRITSFCSLRGYTVLRILKDFGDKNGERNVFDYFAAGWNRDGLALRGMGELMKSAPADRHLLILLTAASPDDSRKILPSGKIPSAGTTTGRPAWTIRRRFAPLRQQGIQWQQCSWGKRRRSCGQCHLRPGSGPHPPDGSAGRGGGRLIQDRSGVVRLNDSNRQRVREAFLPIFRRALGVSVDKGEWRKTVPAEKCPNFSGFSDIRTLTFGTGFAKLISFFQDGAILNLIFFELGILFRSCMDVLKLQLVPFLVVSLVSTPLVYAATVWSVRLLMKLFHAKEAAHD